MTTRHEQLIAAKTSVNSLLEDLHNAITIEPTGLILCMGQCIDLYDKFKIVGLLLDAAIAEPAHPFPQKDGDWPEDFSHENGQYFCNCCQCHEQFTGHKRRVLCKKCATKPAISGKLVTVGMDELYLIVTKDRPLACHTGIGAAIDHIAKTYPDGILIKESK